MSGADIPYYTIQQVDDLMTQVLDLADIRYRGLRAEIRAVNDRVTDLQRGIDNFGGGRKRKRKTKRKRRRKSKTKKRRKKRTRRRR